MLAARGESASQFAQVRWRFNQEGTCTFTEAKSHNDINHLQTVHMIKGGIVHRLVGGTWLCLTVY
jgi:hypothetical protein